MEQIITIAITAITTIGTIFGGFFVLFRHVLKHLEKKNSIVEKISAEFTKVMGNHLIHETKAHEKYAASNDKLSGVMERLIEKLN